MNFIIPSKLPVRARGEYKVLITLAGGLLDFDSLSTIFWKMLMVSDLPFDLEKKILACCVPKKSPAQWPTTCKRWYTLLPELLSEKHLAQAGRDTRVHLIFE
ncbi:hypothetical protein YC2023_012288 [Brassica napus]